MYVVLNGIPNGIPIVAPNVIQIAYQWRLNGFSNSILSDVPNGVPIGIPNGILSCIQRGVPNGIPSCVPNGVPNAIPNGVPNCVPNAIPNWCPEPHRLFSRASHCPIISLYYTLKAQKLLFIDKEQCLRIEIAHK